jgi:PAS domain S-box-containing protein
MAATKIRILSVVESQESGQNIHKILDRSEDFDVEFDWITDLSSGIEKLQQHYVNNYDLYIVDDLAISAQINPTRLAVATLIELLKPASVILLTDDCVMGLTAIKLGAIDYWHKERLNSENIRRSLYLLLNSRNENKLAEEAIYQKIFYNYRDGIFLLEVDENNKLIYKSINLVYAEEVGIAPIEIVGKTIAEVMPDDCLNIIERKLLSCIETKQPLSYEIGHKHNHKNRIYHTTIVPIVDNFGKVIKLQGSSRDLTAEKEAIATQIRQTRYRLSSLALKIHQSSEIQEILQTSVQEILKTLQVDRVVLWQLVDRTQRVITEAVAYNIKPIERRSLSQQESPWEIFSVDSRDAIEVCCQIHSHRYSPDAQNSLQQEQIVAYLNIPICQFSDSDNTNNQKKSIWGILSLHQCYHSRRWTTEEIEILQELANQLSIALYQDELLQAEVKKKQELMRSNAELEQFAYIASHDLQAPLQTIGNYSKLLQRRYQQKLDEKADKFLYYIVEAAQRMQNQIEDLLEYSRIGKQHKNYEALDCQSILDNAIANLRLSIDKNKANIHTINFLPTLVADRNQLLLLWQNLIANAIKYRTEEPPTIVISSERQGNFWLFKIADNGIGIDSKYHQRIFQIFQRLHTQEEYPGTGIGLAICQKIVENHNGSIWVESNDGRGSAFCFTFASGMGDRSDSIKF